MSKRENQTVERPPWKLLLWTALAGLIFGLIGFGEVPEDWLRVARNSFHKHQASGEIVVVKIDDKALREYGNWPWPRRYHAQLVDKLTAAGAKRIFFDINFSYRSDAADDRALTESLERSGRVTLGGHFTSGRFGATKLDSRPLSRFGRFTKLASMSLLYNYQNAVWNIDYAAKSHGENIPTLSAAIAGKSGDASSAYPVDYSIELQSIPAISAADVLDGSVRSAFMRNKTVLIGTDSDVIGDKYFIPGYGRAGGVYVHALGAESLREGPPLDLGWIPALLMGISAAAFAATRKRPLHQSFVFGSGLALILVAPAFLEAHLIFLDVTPGLFVLLLVAGILGWRRFQARGFVNPVSNLPNLSALRADRDGRKQALIAARVLNFEEITATLAGDGERQLIDQIVSRLTVGASGRILYQGDGGIFAWFEDPKSAFGNHLDALYALFRNPARVGGVPIDVAIAFGVEIGSSRSLGNRLASALVAADEAAHQGLKWKYHDPHSLEDASWKLSILSELDAAIDRGEVWVAYQPKLDLQSRQIVGAEALARWTHPEKGPIAASEFVAAAEQHDRIGKLTDFVLQKAIAAAASLNKKGIDFGVAVNLSARLLTDKGFILRVSALLARHGLPADRLTLELTETAALAGSGEAFDMLATLRELGIRVSIDDYGTGLSTLEYLKKIPADEIKIDQSFVKSMVDNRSDRLMVQSTIGLAHSLGRKVVAEGVEQREALELLTEMECDIVQGFAVGRPMSAETLAKRIAAEARRSAA